MTTSHVAEFSCCVPRSGDHGQPLKLCIALFVIMLSKHSHTVAALLVPKGTKRQLSVYDKMPMLYVL